MKRRIFTDQERLSILKEAAEHGVKVTLEKHSIYPSVYYKWKKKYSESSIICASDITNAHLKRIRDLEKQLQSYKELVEEKELQIRMHEAVKKGWTLEKKNKR